MRKGKNNTGGDGVVTVDGKEYPMKYKEALYVGCGNKEVTFKSNDAANPAKFYINRLRLTNLTLLS